MTLTYKRLFTLFGFCLLLVSCDTFDPGPGQPESEPVKFTTIRQASHSGLSEETTTIIRERDDFEAFWQELHANRKPVPETPSVDFEKKMVLIYAIGAKPTGGYSATITDIATHENTLVVNVTNHSPGDRCIVTQALTSPYHMVELESYNLPLDIQVEETVTDCS